ncbi:MAG: glycosyl transferase [Candidatus Omnitrophica bacterium CG07_land_8_20_14_0_80_50_8]|nr:MAG: hypothetical protein AUJ71_03460 [Candidatus Omnitrophica bacterium CG1_02_49_16]PIU40407.1 MAG: glycosyl transferase [Candidatus Omnitrophica bacterium CG07_land_8_20_14_0_80_50_8]
MPTEPGIEISVVIPVYNEEKNIAQTMRRVRVFMSLKNLPWECWIVNDGSSDNTAAIVRAAIKDNPDGFFKLVSYPANHGKGFAVRHGVLEASGRTILVTDADLSAPIKELDKLMIALADGYDIALGSRAVRSPGADVKQSFKRWCAGRLFNSLVRLIVLRGIADTQCGFKCFKKEAARALFSAQKLDGFSFDVEVLCLAQKKGLRIQEVPVMWREGRDTRVRLFRDSLKMLKDVFYLRRTL